jgi:hypothetical protein
MGDIHMLKGLDKFEMAAVIAASIGVIGSGIALYVLSTHVQ